MARDWKAHNAVALKGAKYDDRWYDMDQVDLSSRWGIERYGAVFKLVSSDPTVLEIFGPFDTFEAAAACFETLVGVDHTDNTLG